MQKNEEIKRKHAFSVDERKILNATGILDVEEFDETKIYAMLEDSAFTIGGKHLKVIGFSSESGNLKVEGEIDSVSYSPAFSKKSGIIARIFR